MEHDVIYHERFTAKGFIAILSPITVFMLVIMMYHLLVESAEPFLFWTLFYITIFIAFLLLTINFATLTITMTSESITVGFGILKRKIPIVNIADCNRDDVSSVKYGGFGIRVAKIKGKKRLVYNTIGTPRVLLSLKEGRFPEFVFSTKSPEEVINVIRAQLSLTR
ncbi:MAG: hypothetical protein JSW28_00860 [Thermoplasmata archaeon]|nr:MAG: hypothetical protein JSW28_00860 [Thermoplasmata archaeon]